MDANTSNRFGERVLFFRKHKHMTQETLAKKAGLSQGEVSRIETGHFRDLTRETIVKLAHAFEIQPQMLVRGTPFAADFGQSETAVLGSKYQGPPFTVYFASALTGLDDEQLKEVTELDEKVNQICNAYSAYPLVLYRPRLTTSPQDNPEMLAREVYEIDEERVATADIVVLAAVFPSLGAGMELQLAYKSCSSIILLAKAGKPLSRMVSGCPASQRIVTYSNVNEVEAGMIEALSEIMPDLSEFRFSEPSQQDDTVDFEIGHRIEQQLRRRGTSADELAKMIGVGKASVESLLTKPEQVSNPSLRMLRRISRALGVSEAFLITGYEMPIQYVNPLFGDHLQSLRNVAARREISHADFECLWKTHVDKYQYELSVPSASYRANIGDEKYWDEKYGALQNEKSGDRKLF